MCLVYGAGQQALEMAQYLARTLSVTLLLSDQDDLVLPQQSDIPIYRGDIETMSGSFGGFSLTVNNYAPLMPSARKNLEFVLARDGASTTCSLVLDISGKNTTGNRTYPSRRIQACRSGRSGRYFAGRH